MNSQDAYISVQNLRKQYKRKKQQDLLVLDKLNFQVERGEFICIVGGSGCGKSTLLRVISGLDSEYDGEIFIENVLVKKTDSRRGFVYQEHRLFPWMTVEKNVGFVINDGKKDENDSKVKKV